MDNEETWDRMVDPEEHLYNEHDRVNRNWRKSLKTISQQHKLETSIVSITVGRIVSDLVQFY